MNRSIRLALLIVLGCFIDSIPAIIMFLPVIQSLGDAVGIHPVQMGVVVVMTLALGLVTPPYGVCLLVASRLIKLPPRAALAMTALFGSVSLVVISLAVPFPDVTLLLPRLLMSGSFQAVVPQ